MNTRAALAFVALCGCANSVDAIDDGGPVVDATARDVATRDADASDVFDVRDVRDVRDARDVRDVRDVRDAFDVFDARAVDVAPRVDAPPADLGARDVIAPVDTPPPACPDWPSAFAPGTLNDAVHRYACVRIAPGTHVVASAVLLPLGHRLTGYGRDMSALTVPESWPFHCCESVVGAEVPAGAADDARATLDGFAIDGRGLATYLAATEHLLVENMRLDNARCSATGATGPGMIVRHNIMTGNAQHTVHGGRTISCATPPVMGGPATGVDEGAAFYGQGSFDAGGRMVVAAWAPVIESNTITRSFGPAIDINGVWGGVIRDNDISENSAWAAISLYAGSNWTVEGNRVSHPTGQPAQPYHPYLRGGPIGAAGAGMFLGQDTDDGNQVTVNNVVRNNHFSGDYGILSIGADEVRPYWAPRNNRFEGNDVFGSRYGCADDFRPGQWMSDQDIWSGNNCAGGPDTGPGLF